MTLMGRLGYLSSANAVMEPSSRQIADNRIGPDDFIAILPHQEGVLSTGWFSSSQSADNRIGPNDFIAILRHQEGVLSTVGSRAILRHAFSLLGEIEHV